MPSFAGGRWLEVALVEPGRDFTADFVALAGDAGTDPGEAILRAGAECVAHDVDGLFGDPPRRALPSCVRRAGRACAAVVDQDRVAVGGEDADEKSALAGDECVVSVEPARRGDDGDLRAMHLPGRHDALGVDPEKRPEPPVIFQHMRRIVADVRAKIQRIQRLAAHPARACSLNRHEVGDGAEDGGVEGGDC